jgi:hypothetical protein
LEDITTIAISVVLGCEDIIIRSIAALLVYFIYHLLRVKILL